MVKNIEYLKLFWEHEEKDDPVVILYEVDLDEERYATRLIEIFSDGHTNNIEDEVFGFVTEMPVPVIEEFNSDYYGEDFNACLISKEEFEKTWNNGFYEGSLYVIKNLNNKEKK